MIIGGPNTSKICTMECMLVIGSLGISHTPCRIHVQPLSARHFRLWGTGPTKLGEGLGVGIESIELHRFPIGSLQ